MNPKHRTGPNLRSRCADAPASPDPRRRALHLVPPLIEIRRQRPGVGDNKSAHRGAARGGVSARAKSSPSALS